MKQLLFLLFFLPFFSATNAVAQTVNWVITNGCWLKVDGSTNINIFSCAIINYGKPDTISINTNHTPIQLSGCMQLDVQNFDCHNPVMTLDLRKTLKAKQFPKLIIRFQSLNHYPASSKQQGIIKGFVTIELAGVSKRYEVDYKVVVAESNYINLEGSRKVNFSDFNLEPPRKVGGMIRTNNELSVVFNLRMKVI
jgi:hypothetical protein